MVAYAPRDLPPDIDLGPPLIILQWTLAGIAALVLGLRLFTSIFLLRAVRVADYFIILAFVRHILSYLYWSP
jgi:hypothetical protein